MSDAVRVLVVSGELDPLAPFGAAARYYTFVERLARRAYVSHAAISVRRARPVAIPGVPSSAMKVLQVDLPRRQGPSALGKAARVAHFAFDPLPMSALPGLQGRVAKLAHERRADVVVTLWASLAHLLLRLPPGRPTLAVMDEGIERFPDPYLNASDSLARRWMRRAEARKVRRLYQELAARRAHVVAISDAEADWFARSLPRELITVIPHGVDLDYWSPRAGSREEDLDVLVVGDLNAGRNVEPTVELFDALEHGAGRSLRWALVGKEPLPAVVALRSERVEVSGYVEDVRPYYERAKLVVVPARDMTGTKTTLLQGWAMGKPVVAAAPSTAGVDARPSENLVMGATTADLAAHVLELLADADLRARLGAAGRRTAEADHDVGRWAEAMVDLCLELAPPKDEASGAAPLGTTRSARPAGTARSPQRP
jgi:glycosyltransferase involved in cell wall biosynthesis